jgi:hypothetical protein
MEEKMGSDQPGLAAVAIYFLVNNSSQTTDLHKMTDP